MLRKLSLFALSALAVSLPASALDIERIELKSGIGQPLLAEIPVVSADRDDLRKLQARLASPATFARIGLERPRGVVASLQFQVARNAGGKPVIRVTSAAPVEQEFLTFLIQVDWGDGRMVREYSVSLSAPDAIASPMPPPVGLPEAGAPGLIARAAPPVAIPLAADVDAGVPNASRVPAQPVPLAAGATVKRSAPSPNVATKLAANVATKAAAATPAPRTSSRTPATPGPARAPSPGDYGPVRTGDMLSKIARDYVDDRHDLNQAMLALLRVNPGAFIGGNINLLRQGSILRAPAEAELSGYDAAEAAAMVQEHIRSWREGKPVPQQPSALPTLAEAPLPPAMKAPVPRVAPARLEISPAPDEVERMAALQSGAARDGTGDVLLKVAAASAESQAMRSAELRELRARIAELDQLQREQQALLSLKDAELAARPAERVAAWPWLAAAFAVLLPLAWWLGRRGAGARMLAASGPSPLVANAGEAGHDSGYGKDANGPQTDGVGRPHSSAPAWHPGIRDAVLEGP